MQPDLRTLPLPMKALFTAFMLTLGVGYLVAVLFLFLMDVEPHQRMGMDVLQGTIHKYYGRRGDTALESVLKGSMGDYLTTSQKELIFKWIEGGSSTAGFPQVSPLFEKHCAECHSPSSGLSLSPLTTYDEVKILTATDLGESIKNLASASHVHLFAISFMFLLTGFIFALSSVTQLLKVPVVVIPFASMLLDIASWWITKYRPVFAYTVIIGGALTGVSLAAQISCSLYDMWLRRT